MFLLLAVLAPFCVPAAEPALRPVELTVVDPAATGYATFQSHNQKVVANRRGIFMTHLRSRNEAYTAQQWRLSWSRDGGRTFTTLHEATDATNPPVIESDDHDNVYLVRPDFVDGHAYLYRFLASQEYRDPTKTRLTNGAAGKYCLLLDPERRQLCYFAHNGTFHRIGLDGTVRSTVTLLKDGKNGALQYPHLYLDAGGTLHTAWTTVKHGVYLYWDIHHMLSPDGGTTWRTMTGVPVEIPAVADDTGPTPRITLDDEFEVHTWLESFAVRDGKAHFLYLAQSKPPRQHYMRYDVANGRREADLQPEFRGRELSLSSLDGFFATARKRPGAPIYAVSREAKTSRIACLVSVDGGRTWKDHAVSAPVHNPYSIGGCREVTPDGWIIGSFTEQFEPGTQQGSTSRVNFFRIRALPAT